MGGEYAHKLDELTDPAEGDMLVISDLDAPSVLKRVTLANLREVLGSGTYAEPVTEDPAFEAPEWNLIPIVGGWQIQFTSKIADAYYYFIERRNVNTGDYDLVAYALPGIHMHVGSQDTISVELKVADIAVREYGTFRVFSGKLDGTHSPKSNPISKWAKLGTEIDWVPTAPTLSDTDYPEVVQTEDKKFSVRIKIVPAAAERKLIESYEVRVRRWDTIDGQYDKWRSIPKHVSAGVHKPKYIIYEIAREHWKNSEKFQVAVRAKPIPYSEEYSAWSDPQTIDPTVDLTPLDAPGLYATANHLTVRVYISRATRPPDSDSVAPDLDHYILQYQLSGGDWTPVPTDADPDDGVITTPLYDLFLDDADVDKTVKFRARAVDYAGNESAWSTETTPLTITKITTGVLASGAVTASKVGEIALFGWQFDGTYSAVDHNTVSWTSGILTLTDETTYSIDAGSTGDISSLVYIYFDINTPTALQWTTKASTAIGQGKILMAVAKDVISPKKAEFQVFGGSGDKMALITADNIAANTITANEIYGNTITANEMHANALSVHLQTNNNLKSASSGARVEIFPDADTGLAIYDNASNDVFKAIVGGTDVGDVILGDSSNGYVKWDKSAGKLEIKGQLTQVLAGLETDQSQIIIEKDGSLGVIKIYGGAELSGKIYGEGVTEHGSSVIWLRHEALDGSWHSDLNMKASNLTLTHNDDDSLIIQNISAAGLIMKLRGGIGANVDKITLDAQNNRIDLASGGVLRIDSSNVIDSAKKFVGAGIDLTSGGDIKINGTTVITSAGVLQNVTWQGTDIASDYIVDEFEKDTFTFLVDHATTDFNLRFRRSGGGGATIPLNEYVGLQRWEGLTSTDPDIWEEFAGLTVKATNVGVGTFTGEMWLGLAASGAFDPDLFIFYGDGSVKIGTREVHFEDGSSNYDLLSYDGSNWIRRTPAAANLVDLTTNSQYITGSKWFGSGTTYFYKYDASPTQYFYRYDTAGDISDNDVIGTLGFYGEVNNVLSHFATIFVRAIDTASGSEDGRIGFTLDDDGASTERFVFDSDGTATADTAWSPFTGAHFYQGAPGLRPDRAVILNDNGEIQYTTKVNDKRFIGVIILVKKHPPERDSLGYPLRSGNIMYLVAAAGDCLTAQNSGVLIVGPVENGDRLCTSSVAGHLMKQPRMESIEDMLDGYVMRARQTVVQSSDAESVIYATFSNN